MVLVYPLFLYEYTIRGLELIMKKICILFFLVCINNHSAHAAGIIEPEIQDAINEYFGHHEYEESDFSRYVNNLSRVLPLCQYF